MIDAIGDLIEAGRVKVYAVDSYDSGSWYRDGLSLEQRAQQHGLYEDWIVNQVVPFIRADLSGDAEIAVTGVSFGAYHAANFALRRADLFPSRSATAASTTCPSWRMATRMFSVATRCTSTTRLTTSRTSAAITSIGCAAGSICC